jgi:hypothetical protein
MTVIETSQRLRRTQRKVLRLQRRMWLAQLAVWPTAIVLAVLLVGALWVLWQRRSAGRRPASAPAADALPHEYAP